VLRGAGGDLLVVEGSAGRIRRYASDGTFIRDLGRRGDGPGEFRAIIGAALNGDTLLVLDRDGAVTRMGLDGSVIDTRRTRVAGLTDERFNPNPNGILADGRVLVRAPERVFGRPDGDYIQSVGWLTIDPAGRVDTLAFLDSQRVRSDDGVPRPYRPWIDAGFAASNGQLWLSSPNERLLLRPEVDLEIRLPDGEEAPSLADLERFREQYVGRGASDNDRRVISEWVDGAPVAETLPPWRHFTVDLVGRIWLERWPSDRPGAQWDVFSGNGTPIATAALPLELRVEDAGGGWLLGVWVDDLGVERVGVFRLEG
jgi:hypothetical protein